MKCTSIFCFLAVLGASSAAQLRTGSPVERVVILLKELKGQIEADSDAEQNTYDKFACWCEKATSNKAIAIGTATAEMRAFSQKILTLKGEVATLSSEIDEKKAEIKKTEEEQAELTSIRQNENKQYMAESTEMMQALAALEQAMLVLRKATNLKSEGGALLQEQATARSAVQDAIRAFPMRAALSEKQMALLSEFTTGASALQAKYSPQSATVQGIMGDMYETFSADLEAATSTEATKNTDYETAMELKDELIATNKEIITKKEAEKASAEAELADTTEAYELTYAQKLADIKFFDETKLSCMDKADEMTERKALRAEELKGIIEALDILTADDARDLFAKAIKPGMAVESFFQLSQISHPRDNSGQLHAYDALKKQAGKFQSMRLAQLAASVRLAKVGHFDEVLKAIDEMMQTLTDENTADISKRDECKSEYHDIASKVADLSWKIEKNEAKIAKLESLIELRTKQKEETIEEISTLDKQVKEMTEARDAEHDAWKSAKKDDEDAIDLLEQAIAKLSSFYTNHSIELGPIQGSVKGLSFQQQKPVFDISNSSAPDATLSGKGVHKGESKNAISILTMIKEDLENEIKVATKYEEEATATFLANKAAAAELRAKLVEKKDALTQMIADRGTEKVQERQLMGNNIKDKKAQTDYKAEITPDCDFILRTFEDRAAKRAAEMQGLTEAKEYLAGQNAPASAALLEKNRPHFDDSKLPSVRFLGVQ